MCSHTEEALQQVFNEVWLHRFSSHLVPFSPFPFTHICSPLFFHVLLSSCLGISFLLSFVHTLAPPLVCTRATYLQPRFLALVFTMRWVFIICPCALGSLFIATTYTFVPSCPLVMSSFFCHFCAHAHSSRPWLFSPPLGEACVCNPWNHRDPT